ncbi:MAG: putative xylitol transport system permease protein [Humisphaera sp.]|nr:putative xylitol transport system permease protein [Humisphaera sp.]
MEAPSLALASPDGGAKRTTGRGMPRLQEAGLVVVILFLVAVLSIYGYYDAERGRPNTFLNYENLIDGIATPMSYYAIMAVGVTIVIITAGIDISVGSAMALAALSAGAVLPYFDRNAPAWQVLPVAFAVPLGVGLIAGLVNGALIVALRVHPFIITLGTLSIYRGIANVTTRGITQPSGRRVLPDAFTSFMWKEVLGLQVMPLAIMLACVALGWIFLHLLVAGRETYAIGGNEEAARFSGLRVEWIKLRVYLLAGLAAGVAGLVSLGRFGTVSASTGTGYELTVIAAAVVGGASLSGGRGTALGALLGTLVIALIQNGIYILHLQEQYRLIITGAAIIIAVALDRFSEYLRNRSLKGAN